MKSLLLLVVCTVLFMPSAARSYDGDVPDPFCNVRVATATSDRGYKHPPKDIKRVQTQFTKLGIKSLLGQSGRRIDKYRTLTNWFLTVYPSDASEARHLVEGAKQRGLHVEPDYTEPKPVFP